MTQQFQVSAVRDPELDEAEVRRRLAAAYRLILEAGRKAKRKEADPVSGFHLSEEVMREHEQEAEEVYTPLGAAAKRYTKSSLER